MVSCFFSKVAVGFIYIVTLSTNEHQVNYQNFQARKQVFPGFGVLGVGGRKGGINFSKAKGIKTFQRKSKETKQNKFTFNIQYSSYLRSNCLSERPRCHIV